MRSIYEAWAVPSQIERWFLRSAEYVGLDGRAKSRDHDVEAGDGYLWRWHGHLDDVNERGLITEANGLDKFAFTYTKDCMVRVSILEEGRETVVELTQSGMTADPDSSIYIDCSNSWTFYLANLKSILEGGIDLRNKNADIRNVINS
jgi:uncharacterized protein YndB with AHSA1/START domain